MRSRTVALILVFVLGGASAAVAQTGTNGSLPRDVHPDSRNRLPLLKPGVEGVAAMRLHASGVDVRWLSPLGRQLTELAILAAAREHDQPYEWSLHEMEALAVGLDPAVVDVVRHRKSLTGVAEKHGPHHRDRARGFRQAYAQLEYLRQGAERFGKADLVDVVSLMANYAATATRLTAVNQQMPPGWQQLLPLPFTPPDDIHADSRSRLAYIKGEA